MSDLVNRTFLALLERAIGPERIFFKEETNLVAGPEEVVIAVAVLLLGRED